MRKLAPARVSYREDFFISYSVYMMTGSFVGTLHVDKIHVWFKIANVMHALPETRGRFAFTWYRWEIWEITTCYTSSNQLLGRNIYRNSPSQTYRSDINKHGQRRVDRFGVYRFSQRSRRISWRMDQDSGKLEVVTDTAEIEKVALVINFLAWSSTKT